jgi:hypothetical protein
LKSGISTIEEVLMGTSYLKAALQYTGAEVIYGLGENCYDPSSNTIYINSMNETSVGNAIKAALKRPTKKNYSLAHELGHAVFSKMDLENKKRFQDLFGTTGDYGGGLKSMVLSALGIGYDSSDTLTAYGASDPEEDFADCFAHLCLNGNRVTSHESELVMMKLEYVQKILTKIKRSR